MMVALCAFSGSGTPGLRGGIVVILFGKVSGLVSCRGRPMKTIWCSCSVDILRNVRELERRLLYFRLSRDV